MLPDDPFIILYLHVQIEICCNKTDSNNIVHLNIQAKTAKVVQQRNTFLTQLLMLPKSSEIVHAVPQQILATNYSF